MISIFYHCHSENDLQIVLIIDFTRPKHYNAPKIIWAGIVIWLVSQGTLYGLLSSKIIDYKYIELEVALVNILVASGVLLLIIFLILCYSGTPFESDASRNVLVNTTMILLY